MAATELHLPWFEGESPETYHKKELEALGLFRETDGYRAIRDILDARIRQCWGAFERERAPSDERLRELHIRASEVAFLRDLLEGKATELARKAEAERRKERDVELARQQRLARHVDPRLATAPQRA